MKKIISIIITLLMAVSMLTTFAFAETITGSCGGNVSFTIDTVTGTLVISGTGDMNDFEAHLGMSGTSWFSMTPFWNEYHSPVSDPEFKYDYTKYIKNVIIEEGVTSIGKYLFYGCDKIESITIPKSIKKIGQHAFSEMILGWGNPDKRINFDNIYISDLAKWCEIDFADKFSNPYQKGANFYVNGVKIDNRIEIPQGTSKIKGYAFNDFGLKEVVVRSGVTEIMAGSFEGNDLYSVYLPSTATSFYALYSADYIFYEGTKEMWDETVHPTSSKVFFNVPLPAAYAFNETNGAFTIKYNSVTQNETALCNAQTPIKDVYVLDGVTAIGNDVFKNCTAIETVSLPSTVTLIGNSAFSDCTSLKNIVFDGTMEEWYGLNVGADNEVLDKANIVFKDGECGYVSDTVKWAYNSTDKTLRISGTGTIPNFSSAESTPWYKYRGVIVTAVVEEGVTGIGFYTFTYFRKLKTVSLPKSVKTIGANSFFLCESLESIIIPEGVTTIGGYVFNSCTSLNTVYLPKTLLSVGNSAFVSCTSLISVCYSGTQTDWTGVTVGTNNECLTNATFYFEIKPDESHTHVYTNNCDTTCNICLMERSITHDFDNACDKECNVCGFKRVTNHAYVDLCDADCNYCGYERKPDHLYLGLCATECELCGLIREAKHSYTDNCDTECNLCGFVREVAHLYNNGCDTECNLCGFTREAKHLYYNSCDTDCNTCGFLREAKHIYSNNCDTLCNVCNFEREITHKYGEFVSDNNATADADGTKTRVCSVCGDKETVKDIGSKLPQPQPTPTPEIKDTSKIFSDVMADAWYKQYVDYAVTHGIFNGTTDTTFAPSMTMTRAQFVQVLANISGVDTTDKNVETVFSDVPSGRWFTPAVKWAFTSGVVTGSGNGKFSPNDNVTREDMCLMLVRYAKYKNIELKPTKTITVFADDDKIGKWAKEAVYTCQMAEIVGGKGNNMFDPKATGSRVEAATIFTRFHQNFVA